MDFNKEEMMAEIEVIKRMLSNIQKTMAKGDIISYSLSTALYYTEQIKLNIMFGDIDKKIENNLDELFKEK